MVTDASAIALADLLANDDANISADFDRFERTPAEYLLGVDDQFEAPVEVYLLDRVEPSLRVTVHF